MLSFLITFKNQIREQTKRILLLFNRIKLYRFKNYPLPTGYYLTVKDWLDNAKDPEALEIGYQNVSPFHRNLPQSLKEPIHSSFLKEVNREGQAIFGYVLLDARIWGQQGTVITSNNRIIVELSPEFRPSPELFSIFQQPFLTFPKTIKGQVILLAAPAGMVYGHWMMDVLPRLAVLERLGYNWCQANYFFINSCKKGFQKRSLELLGIPSNKWISGDINSHVQCDSLIAPSLPGLSGNLPDWAVDWLRKKFLLFSEDPGLGDKIFILRPNTTSRRLINQEQILNLLKMRGFVGIELDLLTFEQQIGIFSHANTVVGANGSGMFNIIFCEPGTKVIELFGLSSVNVCQWAASQSINLNYSYLVGESHKVRGTHPHTWDYIIQAEDLIYLLERLS